MPRAISARSATIWPTGGSRRSTGTPVTGGFWSRELVEYHPDGRLLERSQVQFGRLADQDWPESEFVETPQYDPETRRLLQRRIVLRRASGTSGNSVWRTAMVETIDYDPGREGYPLRDETCYYGAGAQTAPTLRYRQIITYEYHSEGQLEAMTVLDEDVMTGEVRSRWVRCGFEVMEGDPEAGDPAP